MMDKEGFDGMKKNYLVKCDERHEVELIDGRYNFCALGHMITPAVAVLLGYELQKVNEREECWMVVGHDNGGNSVWTSQEASQKAKRAHGGTIKHMVALEDDERIVSREDVQRAYGDSGFITKGNIALEKLCSELGFGEDPAQ